MTGRQGRRQVQKEGVGGLSHQGEGGENATSTPCMCGDSYSGTLRNGLCWGGVSRCLASLLFFNVVPHPPSPAWFYVVGPERGG